jgi:23S rRNA pseudouridine1911/1915/1917 synthase
MKPLDILFEDDDILVVNKPAGLLVHAAASSPGEETLADALREHAPGLIGVGDEPEVRSGIVHRLDRDVSGVMVVAKTQPAFERLKEAFKAREVGKQYVALVYGKLPKDHDVITMNIARSKRTGKMVARPVSQEGAEAITAYDVLERFKTATLVRAVIKTGRMHQIRAHFFGIGYPVVGDTLHTRRIKNIRPLELGRLFLHAETLTVPMADGTAKTFTAPLPDELQAILKKLPKK